MQARHWCTTLEAAHRLGLPLGTVERLVSCGVLPSQRFGRHRCISVDTVELYAGRRRGCGIR